VPAYGAGFSGAGFRRRFLEVFRGHKRSRVVLASYTFDQGVELQASNETARMSRRLWLVEGDAGVFIGVQGAVPCRAGADGCWAGRQVSNRRNRRCAAVQVPLPPVAY